MNLFELIDTKRKELQEIADNWDLELKDYLKEEIHPRTQSFRASPRPDDIRAGVAGSQERELLGKDWATPSPGRPDVGIPFVKPEIGDVVEERGRLYRLGEPTPEGDFTTIEIASGRPGMTFLPRYLMSRFTPQKGKDGRHMWIPQE